MMDWTWCRKTAAHTCSHPTYGQLCSRGWGFGRECSSVSTVVGFGFFRGRYLQWCLTRFLKHGFQQPRKAQEEVMVDKMGCWERMDAIGCWWGRGKHWSFFLFFFLYCVYVPNTVFLAQVWNSTHHCSSECLPCLAPVCCDVVSNLVWWKSWSWSKSLWGCCCWVLLCFHSAVSHDGLLPDEMWFLTCRPVLILTPHHKCVMDKQFFVAV